MNVNEILSHAKIVSDLCEKVNREKYLIISTEGKEGFGMSHYSIILAKNVEAKIKQ